VCLDYGKQNDKKKKSVLAHLYNSNHKMHRCI